MRSFSKFSEQSCQNWEKSPKKQEHKLQNQEKSDKIRRNHIKLGIIR
jgi:hypothetical protein